MAIRPEKLTLDALDASSPLRIIAMFIALSEALASAGAIATSGITQLMLTCFAVAFPFVVLAVFVWLLVSHTEKLYAPNQYTEDTPIAAFAEATRRQVHAAREVSLEAVRTAVGPAIASDVEGVERLGDEVVARYEEAVAQSSIVVTFSGFDEIESDGTSIPVSDETTVQEFLDSVYIHIAPAVEPATYGKEWVLLRENDMPIVGIGTKWAEARGMSGDERCLSEVPIESGAKLTATAKSARRLPRQWK